MHLYTATPKWEVFPDQNIDAVDPVVAAKPLGSIYFESRAEATRCWQKLLAYADTDHAKSRLVGTMLRDSEVTTAQAEAHRLADVIIERLDLMSSYDSRLHPTLISLASKDGVHDANRPSAESSQNVELPGSFVLKAALGLTRIPPAPAAEARAFMG